MTQTTSESQQERNEEPRIVASPLYDRLVDALSENRKSLPAAPLASKVRSSYRLGRKLLARTYRKCAALVKPAHEAERARFDPSAFLECNDIMVELTSRCNLRCVYCPKSQPGNERLPGRDEDMTDDVVASLHEHCGRLREEGRPVKLLLSGTGETSFRKDWMELLGPFFEYPGEFTIISNFAQVLSDEEVEFLLNFNTIWVSIDTANEELQRSIRRKVDLGNVSHNITRLQAAARSVAKPCPQLHANCTMNDKVAPTVQELARFTSALGLSLGLSSLYEMPAIPGAIEVRCVTRLGDDEFEKFVEGLLKAVSVYTQSRLPFDIQENLLDLVRRRLHISSPGGESPKTEPRNGETEAPLTRICTQPWFRFTAAADGALYPCCVTIEKIGSASDGTLSDVLNGETARAFRRALWTGDPPEVCKECSNAPLGPPPELHAMVKAAWESRQA